MADITIASHKTAAPSGADAPPVQFVTGEKAHEPPTTKRTTIRLLRAWLVALIVFGYGPAITYAQLAWLFNDHQWRWTYLLYVTEVPLMGGLFVILLPWLWGRPIRAALTAWGRGERLSEAECRAVYDRAMRLPRWVGFSAFGASLFGYVIGMTILHWKTQQPWIEIWKTFPAIPLVGGMMGAFCYFGTGRALHPVLAWCSRQLPHLHPAQRMTLAAKFLTTTCVLAVAILCLVQPAAYTLTQMTTEHHVLRLAHDTTQRRAPRLLAASDTQALAQAAYYSKLGDQGYVFVIDQSGAILTLHPRGYRHIREEGWYRLDQELAKPDHAWVDRVARHRVIAIARPLGPERTVVSVSFPEDFGLPLRYFLQFTGVVVIEVLIVVVVFGRYYTRSIATPLAELTRAAQRIADRGDLSEHVPVTTNDELSEVASAFNRMVGELRSSHARLEEYTKRLERSTQELSSLNQEMEDLLRVVSHDLRAPLINIQGFSKRLEPIMREAVRALGELAASQPDPQAAAKGLAVKANVEQRFAESERFISKGIEKMDVLLSSLLAVSRVGRKADPVQPHDLDAILDDVLATFDHQLKERTITVLRHPLPRAVPCRRNEINQVFSNLISNAINYMSPAGQRFIEIGGRTADGLAECYIKDTGIGIGEEDHERIFQMFTRLQAIDAPGEGVGLAYVRKIVRSHGGTITVASQRGQGSRFVFTLPAQQLAERGTGA